MNASTSAPTAPARPVSFAALRHPGFRAYFLLSALAMMADNIEHVISYWVMFGKFHSPALGGFAVVSHWLPFLLFSVYSGALADRLDPRRMIQLGMALFMGVSIAWGVLFITGTLQIWHACVLLVVHGCAGVLWGPPSQLLLHDIVGRDNLQSAVRLNATARQLGMLAGPGVGGGLLLWLGPNHVFAKIGTFFSTMAVVTFGGAYAVLSYVAQQAVETYGWLRPGEMLDGLGMAETTPGPLIMVVQFVGFMGAFRAPGVLPPLLAGALGGVLTTWVTFVPCFMWIFAGAPFVETLRSNKGLSAALAAITAAVVGVVLNLAVWFALHTLFTQQHTVNILGLSLDVPVPGSLNLPALVLTIAALLAVFRFKVGMIPVLGACAAAGVLYRLAIGGL